VYAAAMIDRELGKQGVADMAEISLN